MEIIAELHFTELLPIILIKGSSFWVLGLPRKNSNFWRHLKFVTL